MRRFRNSFMMLLAAAAWCGCPSEPSAPPADASGDAESAGTATGATSPAPQMLTEVEPNERTDQAQALDAPCVVEAVLEAAPKPKERASDWYKIAPARRSVVSISLSGTPGADVQLNFRDADRNELFFVDSSGAGAGEGFPNLLVESAAYLRVAGEPGGAGGPYRLTIGMREPVAGEEVEYNGRFSTASEVAVGGSARGWLSHQRDEDWFRLPTADLPTGAVLRIDLTPVAGLRPMLLVADEQERRPLLETKAVKTGEGLVVRNLGLPAGTGAVYLVLKSTWVPGEMPKKFVRTFNDQQAYTLSVSSEAGGDDLEREPDDDAKNALPVPDGGKIRGYLSSPDDVDWYRIDVERPSLLAAELSALNRVDLQLFVVDPAKLEDVRHFELVRINDGGVGEPEVLTNCALQPGPNYLRIEGAWKKVDGEWIRDFVNLDETYSLTVSLRTDDGREEREPNDKAEQASPIAVGATLRGTLHPKRDVDVYRLDLSAQDGPRDTVVECTGIPKVDVGLKLLSPERDERGERRSLATSVKGKGEEKEQIQKELMPGEYLIVVSGSPSGESNTTDQYVLSVSQP